MFFDLNKNPAYKALGYATDVGCLLLLLVGIYAVIHAQGQIRKGEERLGKQSRKFGITFMCVAVGYYLISHFGPY